MYTSKFNRRKRTGIYGFNMRLKNNYETEHARKVKKLQTQKYKMYIGTSEIRSAFIEKGDYITAFVRTDEPTINKYIQIGTVLEYIKDRGVLKVTNPNYGVKIFNLFDPKIYELYVLNVNQLSKRKSSSPKPVKLDQRRVEIKEDTQRVINDLKNIPIKNTSSQAGGLSNPTTDKQPEVKQTIVTKQIIEKTAEKTTEPSKPSQKSASRIRVVGRVWTPEEVRNITPEQLNILSRADMISFITTSNRWGADYRLTKKSTEKLRAFLRKQLF